MKFAQSFRVRFSESDRHGQATPVALFNLLQEMAIAHSESAGRGRDLLVERGLAWMMNRAHLRVGRYPATGEEVSVTTWAHTLHGLYAIREWVLEGEAGPCAVATGRWVLFDVNRGRVIKIPGDFAGTYGEVDERALEDDFGKLRPLETREHDRLFHVRISDLDTNQHANSACYLDWALEAVPHEIAGTRRPRSVEILFQKESKLGEGIRSAAAETEGGHERLTFHHTISGESDGSTRAVLMSYWPSAAEFDGP